MRGLLVILLLITFANLTYGQVKTQAEAIKEVQANILKPKVLKTIQSEVEDVIVHIMTLPEEDRPYIRYFTVYNVPENLKEDVWLQLSFVCHSLIGSSVTDEGNAGSYYPIAIKDTGTKEAPIKDAKLVLNNRVSDTICWIDIRNFNWSPQNWEQVSKEDGYFVEPIVDFKTNAALRLLSGNAVLRADWFIYHATNIASQEDRGSKNIIYNNLIYGGKPPKTVGEFQQIWGLKNVEESRKIGNEFLTLTVNESKTVALRNRILSGYRTELGWLFKSYDVKSETGQRDYVESFHEWKGKPPSVFDGGEMFATNHIQMQVYTLYDGKENLVNQADAALARHMSDIVGDARVRIPTSCIDCHAAGPIPSQNIIKEYIKQRGIYAEYNKADKLRVDRAYLSDKFENFVSDSQVTFARSIKKINGLNVEENAKSYLNVIDWYNRPLTIDQILVECGTDLKTFKEKMGIDAGEHIKKRVPGRLSVLLTNGNPIPRESWESPGRDGYPGVFQQTMILLNGLTAIEYNFVQYIIVDEIVPNSAYEFVNGKPVWVNLVKSTKYKLIDKTSGEYYQVEKDGKPLYMKKSVYKLSE